MKVNSISYKTGKSNSTIFDFTVSDLNNKKVSLEKYRLNNPIIVVNVASLWGLATRNYKELQILYEKYPNLTVLGFPSDQFGKQEYKTNKEIKDFLKKQKITFPVFGKIDVNGENEHPLYTFLKQKVSRFGGKDIPWNYTKFLVVNGKPVKRYAPPQFPLSFEDEIKKYV